MTGLLTRRTNPPLTAAEHLELIALGEVIARHSSVTASPRPLAPTGKPP
jgi:hypothetical protein